jgi:hypothetical protein
MQQTGLDISLTLMVILLVGGMVALMATLL